jgi:hypothetical protein
MDMMILTAVTIFALALAAFISFELEQYHLRHRSHH